MERETSCGVGEEVKH